MKWIAENKTDLICCCISIIIYCVNKGLLQGNVSGALAYFTSCYLNDLMAPIFVLALSSMLLKRIGYELKKLWTIMLMGIVAGLIWEFIIPLFKTSSVTDPYDLLCYAIGSFVYYWIKKLELSRK